MPALRHRLESAAVPSAGQGSLTIVYPHGKEAPLSDVRHAFHDIVLSMMPTHCEPDVCMDVLAVGGPADPILAPTDTLERLRDVQWCRFGGIA
jgi:metal-responsive CopG/Arc/MetJ family transcriptional regulator